MELQLCGCMCGREAVPRGGSAWEMLLGPWQVTCWKAGVAQHRAGGTALRHRYQIHMLNLT